MYSWCFRQTQIKPEAIFFCFVFVKKNADYETGEACSQKTHREVVVELLAWNISGVTPGLKTKHSGARTTTRTAEWTQVSLRVQTLQLLLLFQEKTEIPPILHVKVCPQVLGTCKESCMKPSASVWQMSSVLLNVRSLKGDGNLKLFCSLAQQNHSNHPLRLEDTSAGLFKNTIFFILLNWFSLFKT